MNRTAIATVAVIALSSTAVAQARTSTTAEFRGYDNCIKAAEKQSKGLVPSQRYLIEDNGTTTLYYVNATRWEDGDRNHVRIACETRLNGIVLVSTSIEEGRFDNRQTQVTVELAEK